MLNYMTGHRNVQEHGQEASEGLACRRSEQEGTRMAHYPHRPSRYQDGGREDVSDACIGVGQAQG